VAYTAASMGKDFGTWVIVVTAINTSIVVAHHIIEEQVKHIIVAAVSNSEQFTVHTSTPRAFTHTRAGINSRNSTKPVPEGDQGTFVASSPPKCDIVSRIDN
jgi:hypothetical protein